MIKRMGYVLTAIMVLLSIFCICTSAKAGVMVIGRKPQAATPSYITYGQTSSPGGADNAGAGAISNLITVGVTGTIVSLHYHPGAATDDTHQAAIYTADSSSRLYKSTDTYSNMTNDWYEFEMNVACTSGTTYSCAIDSSGGWAAGKVYSTHTDVTRKFLDSGGSCSNSSLTEDYPDAGATYSIYITVEYYE